MTTTTTTPALAAALAAFAAAAQDLRAAFAASEFETMGRDAPAAVCDAVAEAVKHGERELLPDCEWAVDCLRSRLADIREDKEAEQRDALLGRHR